MPAVPFLAVIAVETSLAATIGTAIASAVGVASVSTVAATAIGLGTISAAATAVQGGSASDILKSAVLGGLTSYVGGTIAANIGQSVATDAFFSAVDAGFTSLATPLYNVVSSGVQGAITSSFNALINERDPIDALIKGGLTAGLTAGVSTAVKEVVSQIPGIESIRSTYGGSALERALTTAVAGAAVSGKDFNTTLLTSLAATGTSTLFGQIKSELKDFSSSLKNDSDVLKRSEEQVDGLINREKDLVTQINDFNANTYEPLRQELIQLSNNEKYYVDLINGTYVPQAQALEAKANNVNAMVSAVQDPTHGVNHPYYQKNPNMWFYNRSGTTIGDFTFVGERYGRGIRGYAIYLPTGETINDVNAVINKVNADVNYVNTASQEITNNINAAKNNLANVQAEYGSTNEQFQNAQNTINQVINTLNETRNNLDAAVNTFKANYDTYQTSLQTFTSAEAENAAIVDKTLNDLQQTQQVWNSYFGSSADDATLAKLYEQGGNDLARGLTKAQTAYELIKSQGVTPEKSDVISAVVNNQTPESIASQYVTFAEARQFLSELGYDPSDDEVNNFVGKVNEDAVKSNVASYVNPRQVTYAEAESYLRSQGYAPTDAEIRQFTGQINESVAQANVASYVNPRQVTYAEAANMLGQLGYSPSDEEIKQFVGQINESVAQENIAAYVNPRQVTEAEARAFFEANGYFPTNEEIKQFVGQINEDTVQQNIRSFVSQEQEKTRQEILRKEQDTVSPVLPDTIPAATELDTAPSITGTIPTIGLDAASGASPITSGQPVDLGASNENQVAQLQGKDTTALGNATLGQTGLDAMSFLEANNIYNLGQGQYASVGPGTMYSLSDIYGYGDGTMADVRPYGDASVAELMAGFTRPTIGTGDARIAEIMASVNRPDQYQMDLVGAEYGTPTSVEWKNVSVPKIKDETGKVHDIPAGAVLNITAEGELVGYRKDNIDFRLDKPGGSFKPASSTGNITSFNPNNKTDAELWADFQKVVPNATKQQYQGWLMAAIAGEKTGMYVPMSAFIPTEEQRTTLLQDVANLAKGAGTGIALGGSDLTLSAIGWAQAAAREAGYNVQFKSLDDVVKFQKEMEAIGNKDFQNIFRSTIMSLPSTAATAGVVMTGGGALGAATVAGASAGLITAGREYADAYSKLISKGYPPDQAHNQALFRSWAIGGAEGLGESIFPGADVKLIRSILNLSPSDIVKQYGTTLAKELPPEIATAALQTYIDTLPGIGLQPNRTYTVDEMLQILRDTTVTTAGQVAVTGAGAKLVQQLTSTPVVNQSGQQVLNRAGTPVLMLTNEQKTTGFHLSYAPPSGGTTMELSAYAQSTPAESIFDAVLENEGKYNYTLQSVNLDNNVFTIKTNDGQTVVFSADQVLNNALNLRTQENPTLAKDVNNSIDIADVLAVDLAKNMQSLPSENISGTIVSASAKGAIMETADGRYIFVPNYGVTSVADGVSAAPIQLGDRVIASNSVLSPVTQIVQPDGAKTLTIDATRVDPLAGLGTVIGLNDSQALVVMPNQQIATVDRANLSTAQNSTLSQGSKIPVNQQILSGINIPVSTIQEDFGLTQLDLLKSVVPPTLTASQLPVLVPIINTLGAQQFINTKQQNVGVGTIISIDPTAGTALIGTSTRIPQVVNLQGSSVTTGNDVLFDPSTGTVLGTPIAPTLTTQTQTGVQTYTPIGTPVTTQDKGPSMPTPTNITTTSTTFPPITTIDTTPGGLGVDTIPGGLKLDTIPGGGSVDITPLVPINTDTIPGGADTIPGGGATKVTKPRVQFPSLFFPIPQAQTRQLEFGYPEVPPPELSGTYELPYPNYLRPLEPYLGYGIGALMGDLYDEKQGNGGNKPIENAPGQITIPT